MIAASFVREDPDWHKIKQLCRIPKMKIFRVAADEKSTDEDIHDTTDERYLLP